MRRMMMRRIRNMHMKKRRKMMMKNCTRFRIKMKMILPNDIIEPFDL